MAGQQRSASDTSDDEENEFANLSAKTRRRIDKAFDGSIREYQASQDVLSTPTVHVEPKLPISAPTSSAKRRKLNNDGGKETASLNVPSDERGGFLLPNDTNEEQAGGFLPPDGADDEGGFLPPDEESDSGGGFMVGDAEEGPSTRTRARLRTSQRPSSKPALTHLPLSWIPRALQILDLPPEEDVLEVFTNAASGWGGQAVGEEKGVSRKDWRAVCAVLMASDSNSPSEEDVRNESDPEDAMELDKEADEEISDDAYSEDQTDGSQSDNDTTSDFAGGPPKPSLPKKLKKGRLSSPSGIFQLTPRQRQGCRDTYSLFFPDVPPDELEEQRIKVQDISRVAQLLKEKLAKEEIMEMLEMFSQAHDKSLGIREFEQMMMTCRLV